MAVFGANILASVELSNGNIERVSTYARIVDFNQDTLEPLDPYDYVADTEGIPINVYIKEIIDTYGYPKWTLIESKSF